MIMSMFSLRDLVSLKLQNTSFFLWNVFTLAATLFIEKFPRGWVTSRQCYSFFDPLVCSVSIFLRNSRECLKYWNHFHIHNAVIDITVCKKSGPEWLLIWHNTSKFLCKERCFFRESSVMQISSVEFVEQRVLNL